MRHKNPLTQFVAAFLSSVLIFTSLSLSEVVHADAPISGRAAILNRWALPLGLGSITDSYDGPASKTGAPSVVLIQDLHLHYPTQRRILKILNHFQGKNLLTGPVAVEGLQGDYDTSSLAAFPAGKVKEKLVDYFMQKGELSGDEAFAILRGESHRLFGVDDRNYYKLNRELYKTTLSTRKSLQAHLARVQEKLAVLKKEHYSRSLRRLDQVEPYDAASAAELFKQQRGLAGTTLLRNLVEIDHSLYFLNNLLRQQSTLEEVRYLAQRLPQFVELTRKLLELDHSGWNPSAAELEETIKSGVDFYSVALMRDEPLAKNTLKLLASQPAVVMIAGGFHTAGVTREFKKAGVGYVVITPRVDEVGEDYHPLYEARVAGQHVTLEEIARDFHRPASEAATFKARFPAQTMKLMSELPGPRKFLWDFAAGAAGNATAMKALIPVVGIGSAYGLGFIDAKTFWAGLAVVGAGVAGVFFPPHGPLASPFSGTAVDVRKLDPEPVKGVKEGLADGIPPQPFSLMEAETVASAADLFELGILGLAGRLRNQVSADQRARMKTSEDVAEVIAEILALHGDGWGVSREGRDAILAKARTDKKFKAEDPLKTITTAVKDVMDARTKDSVIHINTLIGSRLVHGMQRYYGASEGLRRDGLEADEAIASGESIKFPSQRKPSAADFIIQRIEHAIGLRRVRYTNVDVLEGTNAAAGVTETGLAYKDTAGLPDNVHLVNFSGATNVSAEIIPEVSAPDVTLVNAGDGYAHVFVTTVPQDKIKEFAENPFDADRYEESLERLRSAWGGLPPHRIDIVMLNREREREKIERLAELGYNVYLIPDGTLVPALFASMGGRLNPSHVLVEVTSSAAPEATIVALAQAALQDYGAAGSYRLLPSDLPKKWDWIGKVYLSEEDLALYEKLKDRSPENDERVAFDKQLRKEFKFPFDEIEEYENLHPSDWKQVVTGRLLVTPQTIRGDIDLAVTFNTDNPIFKVPGMRRTPTGQVEARTLRISTLRAKAPHIHSTLVKAWIQTTVAPNAAVLANGTAALSELDQRFHQVAPSLGTKRSDPPGDPRTRPMSPGKAPLDPAKLLQNVNLRYTTPLTRLTAPAHGLVGYPHTPQGSALNEWFLSLYSPEVRKDTHFDDVLDAIERRLMSHQSLPVMVSNDPDFLKSGTPMVEIFLENMGQTLILNEAWVKEMLGLRKKHHRDAKVRRATAWLLGEALHHAVLHDASMPSNRENWVEDEARVLALENNLLNTMIYGGRRPTPKHLTFYGRTLKEFFTDHPLKSVDSGWLYGPEGVHEIAFKMRSQVERDAYFLGFASALPWSRVRTRPIAAPEGPSTEKEKNSWRGRIAGGLIVAAASPVSISLAAASVALVFGVRWFVKEFTEFKKQDRATKEVARGAHEKVRPVLSEKVITPDMTRVETAPAAASKSWHTVLWTVFSDKKEAHLAAQFFTEQQRRLWAAA